MKNKITFPKEVTPLLAEEIGLHIGDGSMNYYNGKGFYQLRGHIIDDKAHYITRIKKIYNELFGVDISLRDMSSSGVYGFQLWSNQLVDYKSKFLGLPLGKKVDFLIPSSVVQDNKLSMNFLRGYFDTDGCLYLENKNGKLYPRVEMATISQSFASQLKEMLINLRFRFSHYIEKRDKHGWKDLHRIIIRGNEMTDKWFSEIKPANPKHVGKLKKLKNGPAGTFRRNSAERQ